MAAKFRNIIASKSVSVLSSLHQDFEASSRCLAASLQLHWDKREAGVSLGIDTDKLAIKGEAGLSDYIRKFPLDHGQVVQGLSISPGGQRIRFRLNPSKFVSQVLGTTIRRETDYDWTRNALFEEERKKVLVEFSSPNIAKPFHVGHLRSTILGNFVANIQEAVGHSVTRINYLGDWGTQFGLLLVGLRRQGVTIQEIQDAGDPVRRLLEVYIQANSLAATDADFAREAREAFQLLESGDTASLEVWRECRRISVADLKSSYSTLGVQFDHFHGESMYSGAKGQEVLRLLEEAGLLEDMEDGRRVVEGSKGDQVTVVKSDGSSLYISRDIAAALDRVEQFRCQRLYYVVDNSQESHFKNLFHILARLGQSSSSSFHHVRFGKILGMSSRKGSMVYVSELVEQARAVMVDGQGRSPNTRVEQGQEESTAQAVAVSALIVQDLAKKRTRDYSFSWQQALASNGDTGVKLQYTHARLHSLITACSTELEVEGKEVETGGLVEPIALELVFIIGRWDEVLASSAASLEPQTLVQYLFSLANCTSRALKQLPVKSIIDTDPSLARARLLLFSCSQRVLGEGLRVIGVTPLNRL